jgi:predicted SAM-dependent methyltransferase
VKLNLGCGEYRQQGWVNVDRYSGVKPDLVADASSLPYDAGSAEAVYCGHLLEHLTLDEGVPKLLAEVRRVLSPSGYACFVGPDYDRALANEEWHPLLQMILHGGHRWPGDEHQWSSTGPRALSAVHAVFPHAVEVDIVTLDQMWPVVDRVGWQFAILTEAQRA